ncbi:hypothetical protein AB0I89_24030 [Micromonospora sp. NPDC049801]|uniref:hypothetical protein n=1 Tax=unclassified Micromonospora TaxID=2617518 RepID=UPI0033F3557A
MPEISPTADVNESLIGTVENGPWVLIVDPNLRKVVGEYIADACHTIASDAVLDKAMQVAHDATPQRLDTTSRLVTPDARERLARHLFLRNSPADWSDHDALRWDRRADTIDYDAVYAEADAILAVITGQGS